MPTCINFWSNISITKNTLPFSNVLNKMADVKHKIVSIYKILLNLGVELRLKSGRRAGTLRTEPYFGGLPILPKFGGASQNWMEIKINVTEMSYTD